jgi:hypothetical protein
MAKSVEVAVLEDPAYLAAAPVRDLFDRAFSHNPKFFPGGFLHIVEDIVRLIESPNAEVILGVEDGIPKALCIILFPTTALAPAPQVLHFYNEGSLALRKILTKRSIDILQARGYVKFWGINATESSDSVWARTFRLAGKPTRIGSMVEFDTTEFP